MLFDANRHIPITAEPWSRDKALETAQTIFKDVCDHREPGALWPATPDEDSKMLYEKAIYSGAAGTVWGLQLLGTRLDQALPFDPADILKNIYKRYLAEPDTESVVPSLMLGETGILLLQQKYSPNSATLEKLRVCIDVNTKNPVNEALWGCPGTMLAALRLGEVELFRQGADYLFEQWTVTPDGFWIWYQDLYGRISKYIGAGHGFFGNVYPLLEGQEHLSATQREMLYERIVQTSLASARRENGMANWMPGFFMEDPRPPLTQWCHGSPGVITSLRSFPKDYFAEMEELILEAGEMVWHAGPLKKGISLCHGTDGNGYALLRMFERTGNEMWLERARRFAMHAIGQRNGRSTLWTGEVGLALFLLACIDQQPDFPVLDYF